MILAIGFLLERSTVYFLETAAARSFKPSILLYLASARTPFVKKQRGLLVRHSSQSHVTSPTLTSISVTAERSGPLDKGGSLLGTGSNGEETDGAQRRGVGESGIGRDDREGNVVLERAVLFLLDLLDSSVLK